MSDYSSSIKKINAQLLAFLNRYEAIEDKLPFDNKLLKRLLKLTNSFNTTSNQHVLIMNTHIEGFNDVFQSVMEKYNINTQEVNEQLNEALKIINEKYIKKINLLNEEINLLKEKNKLKTEDLKSDIEFNLIASNQREEIFDIEYEENVRRFEYQIINAKDTYNHNIVIYNSRHDVLYESLVREYNELIEEYQKSNDELIIKIQEKISKQKQELQYLLDELSNEKNTMKERLRQESIQLNNSIKILIDDKNKTIVTARTRYTNSLSDSSNEKEERRQEYLATSQKILKSFVYNMTELDQILIQIKESNDISSIEDVRKYYYQILEITKEQEYLIKSILSKNGSSSFDELDLKTKKLINSIKRNTLKKTNSIKIKKQNYLNMLDLIYELKVVENQNDKIKLELDRNYQTKILAEKEQSDNKYYQQLNSIYENDMNLLINIANLKYTQKANLVRCQSRIKSMEINKDFEILEANYQKLIESVQTKIANITYELEGALTLKELVLKYEENKQNETIRYLSVSTLLEIEKCKLLNEYNHRQYNLNVLNSKTNLLFNKRRIEIKNEKFEVLQNISIQKANTILLRDIVNTAYKIKEEQIFEQEEKDTEYRNSQYKLNSLNHGVLHERFTMEIRSIQQILSTYIMLAKELESYTNKVLSIFFTSISIRPEYYDIINIFVNDFFKIIKEYYDSIVESFIDHESDVIYKRIEFEEKFKFKIFYSNLLETYEAERKRLITKNKNISDTLDNYIKTVEIFKSRIYDLENQCTQLKQKIRANKEQRQELIKELQENRQQIEDLYKKIKDITKLKNVLQKDLVVINDELRKLDNNYNKRVNEIKKMQYNSAFSYYTLRNNLIKITSLSISRFTSSISFNSVPKNKYISINSELENFKNRFANDNAKLFKTLYSIVNSFYNSTIISINKNRQNLLINFEHDIHRLHIKANNQIKENKSEYEKKVLTHLARIKKLDDLYKSEDIRYDEMLLQCERDFENQTNNIQIEQKESLSTFYREYYAVCSNLDEINNSHEQELNRLLHEFNNDKNNLANLAIEEKNKLKANLQAFIQNKDELINQIPQLFKFQTQQLNKENKEINNELESEIKDIKNTSNNTRKVIQKNISNITNTLEETIEATEYELKTKIEKENKIHINKTRHLEHGILKFRKQT